MESTQFAYWDVCFARSLVTRYQMWRWRCRCQYCKQNGRIEWKGSLCKDHIRQQQTSIATSRVYDHVFSFSVRQYVKITCVGTCSELPLIFALFQVELPDVNSSAPADSSSPAINTNVNGRFFTAGVRVRSQASSCEICGGQISTGAVFLRVLRFSPFSICPPMLRSYSLIYYRRYKFVAGARDGAVGWRTALQAGRSRVRFPMVSLEFFIDIILPAALWPGGWLSL